MPSYIDDDGVHIGYCNSCDEEGDVHLDCQNPDCDGDGEMVYYDDDDDEDWENQ